MWYRIFARAEASFALNHTSLRGVRDARLPAWALPQGWPGGSHPALATVEFDGGRIARIEPSPNAEGAREGWLDARGAPVLPAFVEPHVHLDKAFIAHRLLDRGPGLLGGIAATAQDVANWSDGDLAARGRRAAALACDAGVARLRTHVNWWQPDAASSAWRVVGDIAREWRGRLEIERVALMPLRWFADAARADRVLALLADGKGDVLAGAFVHTSTWDDGALHNLIVAADRTSIDVDLHVDEELDPRACGSRRAAEICAAIGLSRRLTLSHACALAAQPADTALATLDAIARAPITIVALPLTNLLLQDEAEGRTPRLRGVTLVHEARQRGIPVLFGSDSVQDAFCSLGAIDPVETMLLAVAAAQLRRPFDDWSDALCGGRGRTITGGAADVVVFPDADPVCWPSRGWRRTVVRSGSVASG